MLAHVTSKAKKVRSADQQAFLEDFYHSHRNVLRRFFMRRISNAAVAEDLTQELFLRLTQQVDNGEIDNPSFYVFQAAETILRERGRRMMRSSSPGTVVSLTGHTVPTAHLSADAYEAPRCEFLEKHLRSMDSRSREIFVLHRLEGIKYSEIAKIYSISMSTVEKTMIKALAHLGRCATKVGES